MKTLIVTLSCLLLCVGFAVAMPPLMKVPPAPLISAAKALALADGYVARTYPKDSSLYCQSARLVGAVMAPVGGDQHWDLVYRHAGAERSADPKTGQDTFNDFHVYVAMTGEASLEWPPHQK
jgi:hypothetical protein